MSFMKKPLGRGDWLCVIVFLLVINIISLWCIDISASAMLAEKIVPVAMVTNGFIMNNPAQTYHIGMYGVVLSTVLLVFICIHIMLKNIDK